MTMAGAKRCCDIIGSNNCPLAAVTNCHQPSNRIRIAQHISPDSINTQWTQSQQRDPNTPSILDLPREIRDAIYDHIVPTDQDIFLPTLHLGFDTRTSHWHPKSRPATFHQAGGLLSLLCASKQLHHEAASRLFTANHLKVPYVSTFGEPLACYADEALRTFGFAGLVPLHPAYAPLLVSITLVDAYSIGAVYDRWTEVRIVNPGRKAASAYPPPSSTPLYPIIATPTTAEQITAFVDKADTAIHARTPACTCLHLISLPEPGTYTLRRPPGPERDRCKKATLKDAGHEHGVPEHFNPRRYGRRRRRRTRDALSLLGLVGMVVCMAPCIWVWFLDGFVGWRERVGERLSGKGKKGRWTGRVVRRDGRAGVEEV